MEDEKKRNENKDELHFRRTEATVAPVRIPNKNRVFAYLCDNRVVSSSSSSSMSGTLLLYFYIVSFFSAIQIKFIASRRRSANAISLKS